MRLYARTRYTDTDTHILFPNLCKKKRNTQLCYNAICIRIKFGICFFFLLSSRLSFSRSLQSPNGIPVFLIFFEYIVYLYEGIVRCWSPTSKTFNLYQSAYITTSIHYTWYREHVCMPFRRWIFILIPSWSYLTHRPNCKCRLICLIYIYWTQRNELKERKKKKNIYSWAINEKKKSCVHSWE